MVYPDRSQVIRFMSHLLLPTTGGDCSTVNSNIRCYDLISSWFYRLPYSSILQNYNARKNENLYFRFLYSNISNTVNSCSFSFRTFRSLKLFSVVFSLLYTKYIPLHSKRISPQQT